MRIKAFAGVCLAVMLSCAGDKKSRDLIYDEADSIVQSSRRTTVSGRAMRDCPLNPGPAAGVLIELVEPGTQNVIASAETDHSGLFVIRSDYLRRPDAILSLRFAGFRLELPAEAYNSFGASLLVPCAASDHPMKAAEPKLPPVKITVTVTRSPERAEVVTATEIAEQLTIPARANIELDVYFELNSARVDERALPQIEEIAKAMRLPSLESETIVIAGFADSTGAAEYNRRLSLRRAESVKKLLVDRFGSSTERLRTVGFGEERPFEPNESDEGRAHNRRVRLMLADKTP